MDGQEAIKRVAAQHRPGELAVLLGTPTAESTRLYSLTVTEGDPAWAGALAGIPLALPVFHVAEDEVKSQVAPDLYEKHAALMEFAPEVDAIRKIVREVREKGAAGANKE